MNDIELPLATKSPSMSVSPKANLDLNSHPFAGRIAGQTQFTLRPSEYVGDEPEDARQNATWKQILDLRGLRDTGLWKNAILEGFGLCLQVFIAGLVAAGLIPLVSATAVGPLIPIGIAAIFQFIVVTLFILAAGPVTGGKLIIPTFCT